MNDQRKRQLLATMVLFQIVVILGCAPYLSDTEPSVRDLPAAWQCPTPSPVPTIQIGWDYDYGGGPPPTPTTYSRDPIYSTPVPTATPYVRSGSDFFRGQRVRVGPLILSAVLAGGDREVKVTVENTTSDTVEMHLELSLVRQIQGDDGRAREGQWYAAGGGDGMWDGKEEVTLTFPDLPPGRIKNWGLPTVRDDQRRSGQTGAGMVWFTFTPDPHCDKPGGPPSAARDRPDDPEAPEFGRGGWPVPPNTVVSRGYGCHPFYTGTRGNCANGYWWHDGIDFASDVGTPLYAVTDMTIDYAGPDTGSMDCSWIDGSQPPHTGFGLYVRGSSGGYVFWYGHASRLRSNGGDRASNGQVVAEMGSTGCSTGSHLHFRVRVDGLDRNPYDVLEKP